MITTDADRLLTVVIPVYNRATIVGETLASLSAQTELPSVVLVDNNSTDDTMKVLKEWASRYKAPVIIVSEEKPGASAARNRGMKWVRTPYVMFFDSDDIMLPNHVERFMRAIFHDPNAFIIGWDVDVEELDGSHSVGVFRSHDLWFSHIFNAILTTQRYAVKTRLMDQVGRWNESLPGWNDYELGFRLLDANERVIKISGQPTVIVRRQSSSITGTTYSSQAGRWEASLRACREDLKVIGNRRLLRYLRLRWAILAAIYRREGAIQLAAETLAEAMSDAGLYQRALLRFAFEYTRLGFRAIHLILRPLL